MDNRSVFLIWRDSETHPDLYPVDSTDLFRGAKTAESWCWQINI